MPEFRAIEILGGELPVKVAPGIAAMSPKTFTVEGVGEFDLEVVVKALPATKASAGKFVCTSLKISQRPDGPEVTLEAIRSIPVATLVRTIASLSWLSIDQEPGATASLRRRTITDKMAARFRESGPTDEALEWVARVYRLAVVLREAPTKAVEEAIGLPRSTAGRWVSLARRRGFLGPSEGPGKAGG